MDLHVNRRGIAVAACSAAVAAALRLVYRPVAITETERDEVEALRGTEPLTWVGRLADAPAE